MTIAAFAGKIFKVSTENIYTFDNLDISAQLITEEIEVQGKKPSTHIKGLGLDGISFQINLDARFVDIQQEYESWIAIMAQVKPYPFIIGAKPVGTNKWILKSVSMPVKQVNNRGVILKASLNIILEEYVRPGTPQKEIAPVYPPGLSPSQLQAAVNLFTGNPDNKRLNTGVNESVAKGSVLIEEAKKWLFG